MQLDRKAARCCVPPDMCLSAAAEVLCEKKHDVSATTPRDPEMRLLTKRLQGAGAKLLLEVSHIEHNK